MSDHLETYAVGIAVDGQPTYVVDVPTMRGREAAERRARMTVFVQLRTVELDRITVCSAEAEEDNR